jgi:hypothetical protein
VSRRAVLFQEADNSTGIFVLMTGEVCLEVNMRDRGPDVIYAAGPGELLGWSPVLGPVTKILVLTGKGDPRQENTACDAGETLFERWSA